jgi:hypothetical protein
MSSRIDTASVGRYLLLVAVVPFALGCQPVHEHEPPPPPPDKITIQGEITTVVKDPVLDPNPGGTGGLGSTAKGSWCCKSCSTGIPIKCTFCKRAASSAGCEIGEGQTVFIDCVGTTVENGSSVTCY